MRSRVDGLLLHVCVAPELVTDPAATENAENRHDDLPVSPAELVSGKTTKSGADNGADALIGAVSAVRDAGGSEEE